jgi:hypothetical protein
LYLTTGITSTGAIEISSGGTADIVKFDGTTWTTVGSRPNGAWGQPIQSGKGHLIGVSNVGTANSHNIWFSTDGVTWFDSDLRYTTANRFPYIVSQGGRVLAVATVGTFTSGHRIEEYSDITTDAHSAMSGVTAGRPNFNASFDHVKAGAIGSVVYIPGSDSTSGEDGLLAFNSAGYSQYDSALGLASNQQRNMYLCFHAYGSELLSGTINGLPSTTPNNFYLMPDFSEALGSSGTDTDTDQVLAIIECTPIPYL